MPNINIQTSEFVCDICITKTNINIETYIRDQPINI